MAELAMLVDR